MKAIKYRKSLVYYCRVLLCVVFLFAYTNYIFSQAKDSVFTEEIYEKNYAKNISKSYINSVYIPIDMQDCFKELTNLSQPQSLIKFKLASEEIISSKLHFGLGRWMMVNWNFYNGSRFSHYLKQLGVSHPDDMAQFTIVSFHRHLNGKDLELDKRAAEYHDARKKIQTELIKKGKILHTEHKKN